MGKIWGNRRGDIAVILLRTLGGNREIASVVLMQVILLREAPSNLPTDKMEPNERCLVFKHPLATFEEQALQQGRATL